MTAMKKIIALTALALSTQAFAGDRLLGTGGAQEIEGQGGGGIVPWALIAGYGTNRQVGGSAFVTRVDVKDFDLTSYGAAVGLFDRVELSVSKQSFDAGSVIAGLKLKTETLGAKVRLYGDTVYEQDSPWPQLALGVQYKRNTDMTIPTAVGAARGSDTDIYLAATKVWLAGIGGRTTLVNVVLRETRANQFGLLGFGGDKKTSRTLQPEFSGAVLLTDKLALGVEYRAKPDNLSALKEENAKDVFLAWFPHRNVAITAAYANLGVIAGKEKQKGGYLSVQLTL